MNFIPLTFENQSGREVTLKTADGEIVQLTLQDDRQLEDIPMSLGIRPEHISLDNQHSVELKLTVNAVELLGGTSYVHASQGKSKELIIEVKSDDVPERHSEATFSFCPTKCHLFDHLGKTIPTIR